jgi:hypothetical protein
MRGPGHWYILWGFVGVSVAAEPTGTQRHLQVLTGQPEWTPPTPDDLARLDVALQPLDQAFDPEANMVLWPVANYDIG